MTLEEKTKLMKLCMAHSMFIKQHQWSLPEARLAVMEQLAECMRIVKAIETSDKAN